MATIDRVRAILAADTVVRTVENTYRPVLNGTRRRIEKCGATVFTYEVLDGKQVGERGRSEFPKARDVVEVTDERVTWRLGRDDHTVTFERAV